jgi:hypothetical protein
MSIFAPSIRFGDLVYAVETTPKTIRNWLQRDLVTLVSEESGGWRMFCVLDVIMLTLVRHLVTHGVSVDEADGLTVDFILGRLPKTKRPDQIPFTTIGAALRGWRLFVIRDGETWKYIPHFGPEAVDVDASVYVVVDITKIVARAVERLIEIAGNAGGGPSD